jgi:hypothetical protein
MVWVLATALAVDELGPMGPHGRMQVRAPATVVAMFAAAAGGRGM